MSFFASKEKVPQIAFILGTPMNTQEREFAPRVTSLLSYSQALEQIFVFEYFHGKAWHFCPPLAQMSKTGTQINSGGLCHFFRFVCVSILGWIFFGVGGGRVVWKETSSQEKEN